MLGKKGEWVKIYNIVMKPEERSSRIPDDTKKVPLEMWTKGFLLEDKRLGELVEIETIVGRRVEGKLVEIKPIYKHNYGDHIPEILRIGKDLKRILFEKKS